MTKTASARQRRDLMRMFVEKMCFGVTKTAPAWQRRDLMLNLIEKLFFLVTKTAPARQRRDLMPICMTNENLKIELRKCGCRRSIRLDELVWTLLRAEDAAKVRA